jgi:tellurite methyltransferase
MNRPIVAFHEDIRSEWVAELACGHRRHVRHDPILSERPWVLTSEGRQSRIGTDLDCVQCDRSQIPLGYEPYRRTPDFDESSVPEALLRHHATKPGIWARIHVTRGSLEYHVHAPFNRRERLTPTSPGIVLPEVEHHVAPSGQVSFFVEFWRPAKVAV